MHDQLVEGLTSYVNPKNGFRVLELHYSADPRKREKAWLDLEQVGFIRADWQREMELSWVTRVGRPVYNDTFDRATHTVGPNSRRGDVPLPKEAKLVVGYDLGPTATRMAASFNLMEQYPPRTWTVDEVYAEGATISEFMDACEGKIISWQDMYGAALHVVDPVAIEVKSRIEERACVDIMRLHGIEPIPGERSFAKRRKAVEDELCRVVRGFPCYNVHERCVKHIEGFEGGYYYPEIGPSRGGGFGALPVKNAYSDIHDALQYAVSRRAEPWIKYKPSSSAWVRSYAVRPHQRRTVELFRV